LSIVKLNARLKNKAVIRNKIYLSLKELLVKEGITGVDFVVEHPADLVRGDYFSNAAFVAAKILKKNPVELAQAISKNFPKEDYVEKIEVVKPGFINFWLSKRYFSQELRRIIQKKEFVSKTVNSNKKIIVEYSSPNIAKPFTIGHLRSTIIGDAVANLLEATGWKVYRDNHIGDWGTQFGKLIYAIKQWGNEEEIGKADNPVKLLVDLYVRFHKEAEADPSLDDKGREWFNKLERGDKEARELWQKCVGWSLKEFKKIYDQLGIKFTENNGLGYGESFFEDKINPVVEELKAKGLLKESEDAMLVFFPNDKFPPLMILKKDGATLYSTRDLATDKFRLEKYGKDIVVINEVGNEQSLYFQQLYELERMLGWYKEGQRIHIKHGLYRFKDEKMSTRKGNTVWLEDILRMAVDKAYGITMHTGAIAGGNGTGAKKRKIMDETEKEETVNRIAVGAIKWNDLKRSSHLDVVFDWDEVLNMEGNSGPYLQYVYARIQSVLSKACGKEIGAESAVFEFEPEELTLLRMVCRFPEVLEEAAGNFAPNILCNYLFEVAQSFNLFYQRHKIIGSETESFRLALTYSVGEVIKNGLGLLGIAAPDKM